MALQNDAKYKERCLDKKMVTAIQIQDANRTTRLHFPNQCDSHLDAHTKLNGCVFVHNFAVTQETTAFSFRH
jgi:hypothetical protein